MSASRKPVHSVLEEAAALRDIADRYLQLILARGGRQRPLEYEIAVFIFSDRCSGASTTAPPEGLRAFVHRAGGLAADEFVITDEKEKPS